MFLLQQIKKDLKKYSKIFEQKDRLSQSKASKVSLTLKTEGNAKAAMAQENQCGGRGGGCVLLVSMGQVGALLLLWMLICSGARQVGRPAALGLVSHLEQMLSLCPVAGCLFKYGVREQGQEEH